MDYIENKDKEFENIKKAKPVLLGCTWNSSSRKTYL